MLEREIQKKVGTANYFVTWLNLKVEISRCLKLKTGQVSTHKLMRV